MKNKPFKCFIGEYENRQILSRSYKGIRPIDIKKIVGTVGRCHDNSNWQELKNHYRYTGIKQAIEDMKTLPPIEVYKVEDEYYIVDGHHRVMASRDIDRHFIDAEIIEYEFKKDNKVLSNQEYHDCPMKKFNEQTGLFGILLKGKEKYNDLLDRIVEFGKEMGDNATLKEIAAKWYKEYYLNKINDDNIDNQK